jgi:hypothetical protein
MCFSCIGLFVGIDKAPHPTHNHHRYVPGWFPAGDRPSAVLNYNERKYKIRQSGTPLIQAAWDPRVPVSLNTVLHFSFLICQISEPVMPITIIWLTKDYYWVIDSMTSLLQFIKFKDHAHRFSASALIHMCTMQYQLELHGWERCLHQWSPDKGGSILVMSEMEFKLHNPKSSNNGLWPTCKVHKICPLDLGTCPKCLMDLGARPLACWWLAPICSVNWMSIMEFKLLQTNPGYVMFQLNSQDACVVDHPVCPWYRK